MDIPFENRRLAIHEEKITVSRGLAGESPLAVMHECEREIMKRHAQVVCFNCGDVLEIGFGMGIAASCIQECKPRSHTIVEIHPRIIPRAREFAHRHRNVTIIEGDWFENRHVLGKYDGVLFHTNLGRNYRKFRKFASEVVKKASRVSFFNALDGPHNDLGFKAHEVRYELVAVQPVDSDFYFPSARKQYYLPIVENLGEVTTTLFVTGCDSRYLWQVMILAESFRRHVPNEVLLVCDFGLSNSELSLLRSREIVLSSPPLPQEKQHPFYYKASLASILRLEAFDAVAWLDADIMIGDNLEPGISDIVTELSKCGAPLAACPDALTPTVGGFLGTWREENIGAFRAAVEAHSITVNSPYLMAGFFVCSSRSFLEDWSRFVFSNDRYFLFDQCALNVLVHANPTKPVVLNPTEWHAHDHRLRDVVVDSDRRCISSNGNSVRILHAAGTRLSQLKLVSERGPRDTRALSVPLKLFDEEPLGNLQLHYLRDFLHGIKPEAQNS